MVTAGDVTALVSKRVGFLLDVAEAVLPPDRFPAFRKIALGQFGNCGLAADIERLFAESAAGPGGQGKGRN